jgi:hypothetical protein
MFPHSPGAISAAFSVASLWSGAARFAAFRLAEKDHALCDSIFQKHFAHFLPILAMLF